MHSNSAISAVALLLSLSCTRVPNIDAETGTETETDADTDADTDSETGPVVDYHATLEDMPCADGVTDCAPNEALWIENTCCSTGEVLPHIATGHAAEAVDLASNGQYVILCGGFGARISDITDPANPVSLGSVGSRCQHAEFGPSDSEGQVFFISHHGDTWVPTPFVESYRITANGNIDNLSSLSDLGATLFEDMAWANGYLYVAAHNDGVRVYQTDGTHTPVLQTTLSGFDNASSLDVDGDHLFIGDAQRLQVFSLANPAAPALAATVGTASVSRDVDAHEGRAYVALGGAGVDVFDVSDQTAPVRVATVPTQGSVQAVHADGDVVALAAWSHIQLLHAESLTLLGTGKTNAYDAFEQDLGVRVVGDHIFVAEWTALNVFQYQRGYVGADLWIPVEALSFSGDASNTRRLRLLNRGSLPLEIDEITATSPDRFTPSVSVLTLEPGEWTDLEVTFEPPVPNGAQRLIFDSNDPDPLQSMLELPLFVSDSSRLDVGDTIEGEFRFLDPTGNNDLANLKGKVIFLAYFALF